MNKEMFNDVFAFAFSEPGAMGAGGYIDCMTTSGSRFDICYCSMRHQGVRGKNVFRCLGRCCLMGL